MNPEIGKTGSELFIVDNSDEDWKVLHYLHDWCQISKVINIATAYFEIGALLALKDEWQKVEKIRILMGDEVSIRTKEAFKKSFKKISENLDASIEKEKEKNDFLTGVPAIVAALGSKINCRVYRKDKFHAKAYITHAKLEVVGASALVGSSNFTFPGLSENIELNVQITGRPVSALQEWFEKHWQEAEDITLEILRIIERHTKEYLPFDVYAKALQEFFRGHELTVSEWERNESKIYQILSPYQQQGYHSLLKRASRYNGAFLCDGVGLGKTYVGLMLIERFVVHERKNVVLFVPKSALEPVWEFELKRRIPQVFGTFCKLELFSHTDLMRGGKFPSKLKSIKERADIVIIDEAHHFRNTGIKGTESEPIQSRYWQLFDIIGNKPVFLLTATPINNRLLDLQHMIELFSRQKIDFFRDAPLGIHSLAGHFRKMENALEKLIGEKKRGGEVSDIDMIEAAEILSQDMLFRELVVQRSRTYVKKSMLNSGDSEILFPVRKAPQVVDYSIKQTYGKLLNLIEEAFNKTQPLFSLAIYYPLAYYKGDDKTIDPLVEGRQKQVVSLIRTSFLKRFESSVEAFTMSCWTLLRKLLTWVKVHVETDHEKILLDRWINMHKNIFKYMQDHQKELFGDMSEAEEDVISEEMMEAIEKERLSRSEYKVEEIIDETILDMDQISDFLKILKDFKPSQDKKLAALTRILKNDKVLSKHKVILFTEFLDTARYLKKNLVEAEITGIEEVDSTKQKKGEIIKRFSPYYNGTTSQGILDEKSEEIRILISTDVLSEGLNLQDCTRLINYDIHWNPVRLMQRIGRVDRRMDPEIEQKLVSDHPDQKPLRGEIMYWNFLPPEELDELLKLFRIVTKKTLRISKTFGIEGRKLLKPDDDYEDLRDFYDQYDGKLSADESMHLEFQQLLRTYPD
ncbi:MAG: phospholipase D-like domain-containing protein, partial [Candidatus Aminicenantes bacterium]|nr:phospholipase D-like domain-containing protein [Candidatus Aminicenantes bacterium]